MEANDAFNEMLRQIGLIAIPVLVPMVLGLFKTYVWARVPSALLPVFAAMLGPLFDVLLVQIAGVEGQGLLAVGLGLAGVGLRELKEAARVGLTAAKGMKPPGPDALSLALALLILGACATRSVEDQVTVACQGYASTLTSLAVAKTRGQLSAAQIATVDSLRPGLNAICLDGDYGDPASARAAVEAAMFELIRIEGDAQ